MTWRRFVKGFCSYLTSFHSTSIGKVKRSVQRSNSKCNEGMTPKLGGAGPPSATPARLAYNHVIVLCSKVGEPPPHQLALLLHFTCPAFLLLILPLALLEQLLIHFHEHPPHVCGQAIDCLVPVGLRVLLECLEDDWQYHGPVLGYQAHDVLIVPQEESSLGNLQSRKEAYYVSDGTSNLSVVHI